MSEERRARDLVTWQRCREGEADAAERAELATRLLADPVLAQRCRERLHLEGLVAAHYAADDDGFAAALLASAQARLPRRSRGRAVLAAAAILAALAVLLMATRDPAVPVQSQEPTVSVRTHAPVAPELSVHRHDDGSRIVVFPSTRLTAVPDAGEVELGEGRAEFAIAARDPAAPYRVHTPHGVISVHGTSFAVTVRAAHSVVALHHGRVSARSGGAERALEPGSFAVLQSDVSPQVVDASADRRLAVDDFAFGYPRAGETSDRWIGRWRPVADGVFTPVAEGDGWRLRSARGGWDPAPELDADCTWSITWRAAATVVVDLELEVLTATGDERWTLSVQPPVGSEFVTTRIPIAAFAPELGTPVRLRTWGLRAQRPAGIEILRCAWSRPQP